MSTRIQKTATKDNVHKLTRNNQEETQNYKET